MSIQRQGSKQGNNFSFSLSDEALENVVPRGDVPALAQQAQNDVKADAENGDAGIETKALEQTPNDQNVFTNTSWKSADLAQRELQVNRMAGDSNIGGNGGGALYTEDSNPWGESKEEKQQKQAAEAMGAMTEFGEEMRKKEQERELAERFEKEKYNFFGDEMSEEEWNTAKTNIRDPKMRAAIKNKLIADGTPPDKAQRAIDIADEILHLPDRVKRGEITAADAQRRKDELQIEVEKDPELKVAVPKAKEMALRGVGNDWGATLGTTKDARAENQGASLDARDNMLAAADAEVPVQSAAASTATPTTKSAATQNLQDEKLFASAPPAGEHFAVAASGVTTTPAAPKVAPAATMAAAVKPDALVC
jgi:hypothetical protein